MERVVRRFGLTRRLAGGLGPVFAFEWLMASRRWQGYALRSLTVLLMLVALCLIWLEAPVGSAGPGMITVEQQAEVGLGYYAVTALILLGLVGLAAPAATAGSICLDAARGNLTLLFATDLSDAEIVLGKLAARLVPVLGLILCAAPVLAIATLFGGIDPVDVVGTLFVVLACGTFGCALALTFSVWGRKTHEVLLATYLFGILYLISGPILVGLQKGYGWRPWWCPSFMGLLRVNPVFLVLSMLGGPPPGMGAVTLATHAEFLGLSLATSALLIAVAIWRIRRVIIGRCGQDERASRGSLAAIVSRRLGPRLVRLQQGFDRFLPGPSLDRDPVSWREYQRRRPSRWAVVLWGGYAIFCGGFSMLAISMMLRGWMDGRDLGMFVNGFQVACGLLMLSVSAATSLAEERQRGSLDVLMATPLSTRSIVWGKWRGAFRLVPRLLILPAILTFFLALRTGQVWGVALMLALILAHGAAITSLGLALATWTPRMGRAVGTTVGLYVMMCSAWVPLSFNIFGNGTGSNGAGVASGSPFFGVAYYGSLLGGDGATGDLSRQTAWTIFWILAYGGIAFGLLLATIGTFNRCLGRVGERAPRRGSRRRARGGAVGVGVGVGPDL